MKNPLDILEQFWGFSQFRTPQEEIITSVIAGNDTIALLPTGGGKSVCFQIPILTKMGICIVISPLISLMNDQIKNLQKRNIKALALTSKISQDELITTFDNLKYGNYKFLYLSPEKLQSPFIQEKIKQLNVQLIAIDEAHCISEWGHDFRPSYLKLIILREFFPGVPTIALTASATKLVLDDIITHLGFENPKIFKKSYYRNNLAYHIYDIEDKLFQVEKILKKVPGVKIIYTNTRKKTIDISNQLNKRGYKSCFYHGGLNYDDKIRTFDSWLSEKTPIIVATNAFGMGIDKPNVRVVIHYDFPKSIENFMQEAGRAGRDGLKSYAVVLKNKTDIDLTYKTFVNSEPSIVFIKQVYFKLNQYFRIANGELLEKSFELDLAKFCTVYKFSTLATYNVLTILEKEGVLLLSDNSNRKSSVLVTVHNSILFEYYERNPSLEPLIKLLLRSYGGIFESHKSINEVFLGTQLGVPKSKIIQDLKTLHAANILLYYNSNVAMHLQFLVPREDDRTINVRSRNIEKRSLAKKEKLDKIIAFISNDSRCRNIQLLTYFNETNPKACGICDICLSKKNIETVDAKIISNAILDIIQTTTELSSKEIVLTLNYSEKEILNCLQILLEKNRITVTSQNKFRLKKT